MHACVCACVCSCVCVVVCVGLHVITYTFHDGEPTIDGLKSHAINLYNHDRLFIENLRRFVSGIGYMWNYFMLAPFFPCSPNVRENDISAYF